MSQVPNVGAIPASERGAQVIWNNKLFVYRNRALFMKNLLTAGLVFIQDLFIDGSFISLAQLEERVGTDPRLIFQHNALLNAIPQEWRQGQVVPGWVNPIPELGDVPITALSSKSVRNFIVKDKKKVPCGVNFWSRKYPNIDISENVFLVPIRATQ